MQEIFHQFLRLPKFPVLRLLFGFGAVHPAWVPSYALMQGEFFKHAISTPVTVLGGYLDQSIKTRASNRKLLENAKHVYDTVQQLLSSLTNAEHVLQQFSVVTATSECIQVCKLLNPGATISFQVACTQSLQLQGSIVHWQEAVSCVVKNACEAYGLETQYKPVAVVLYEVHNTLRLEVIDCAVGMNSITRLVAKYPGISEKPQGSGIGLTFVAYVVERLFLGSMAIDSSRSAGTRVRWTIPLRG